MKSCGVKRNQLKDQFDQDKKFLGKLGFFFFLFIKILKTEVLEHVLFQKSLRKGLPLRQTSGFLIFSSESCKNSEDPFFFNFR